MESSHVWLEASGIVFGRKSAHRGVSTYMCIYIYIYTPIYLDTYMLILICFFFFLKKAFSLYIYIYVCICKGYPKGLGAYTANHREAQNWTAFFWKSPCAHVWFRV